MQRIEAESDCQCQIHETCRYVDANQTLNDMTETSSKTQSIRTTASKQNSSVLSAAEQFHIHEATKKKCL